MRYPDVPVTELSIVIDLLFVHPDFGRRGIGRELVAQGCTVADKQGLMSIVEASPKGKRSYELNDFESKETSIISFDKWPDKPEHLYYWMVREPSKR